MVTIPHDRPRTRFRTVTAPTVGAVVAALACASPALCQKPGDVVKNMQTLYKSAHTYQGTIKQNQSGSTPQGQAFTLSQTQAVTFTQPNKIRIQVSVAASGIAAAMNGATKTVISDGTTIYQYDPKKQVYSRQPVSATMTPLIGAARAALIDFDLAGAKMLSKTSVGGHTAAVIEVSPDTSKLTPEQRKTALSQMKPIDLTIDTVSFALLRIGSPHKPAVVELSNQVFNAPINGVQFAFTPPPGAKLYTPPTGPTPGAAGGTP